MPVVVDPKPDTVNALLATVPAGAHAIDQLDRLQAWLANRPEEYVAADKMTKATWLIILGIALVAHMLIWSPISFLNLIGTVAALVYVVDVRPALRALSSR